MCELSYVFSQEESLEIIDLWECPLNRVIMLVILSFEGLSNIQAL